MYEMLNQDCVIYLGTWPAFQTKGRGRASLAGQAASYAISCLWLHGAELLWQAVVACASMGAKLLA